LPTYDGFRKQERAQETRQGAGKGTVTTGWSMGKGTEKNSIENGKKFRMNSAKCEKTYRV